MFPQFKKINNESGVVLFIVLMTAIIIMIFSLGILTQSINEINYAQQQIDQIASEQLAKGIFWNAYNAEASSMSMPTGVTPVVISGRTYNITMSSNSPDGPVTNYAVIANYDTF